VAPVIRSVKLDAAPRRLAHRHAPGPVAKPQSGVAGPVSAVAPAVAAPAIDPAQQRAWQQRMQTELDAARARVEDEGRLAGHAKGLAQARDEFASQHEALSRLIATLAPAVDAQIDATSAVARAEQREGPRAPVAC
jgi:flagellar biosynthesis/type III secretory pathway protein FliH